MRLHPSLPLRISLVVFTAALHAAAVPAQQIPQTNTSVLDAGGAAHITRVVPVPTDISPAAQAMLRRS